jgi:endonuclease G
MLESALERTRQVAALSPGLMARVAALARRNALPNQAKLGLTPDQWEALAINGRLIPGARITAEAALIPETRDAIGLGFEAIVRQVGRPSLLVQNGTVQLAGTADDFPENLAAHLPRIEAAFARVGRIDLVNHRMQWAGTAWLFGEPGLAVTNRHVAELFAGRHGTRGFGFLVNPVAGVTYGAKVDFLEEYGRSTLAQVCVTAIRYLAAPGEPDLALLELAADTPLPDPMELAPEEAQQELLVGVIGYPAYDSRNDAADIARYFGDIFNKKRFAPGFVTQAFDGTARLMHDCTTLGGNSGSVVLDLASGKVVGLHFAGSYLEGNYAVHLKALKAALSGETTAVAVLKNHEQAMPERPDGEHGAEHFAGRRGYRSNFLGAGFTLPLRNMLSPGVMADAVDIAAVPGGRKTVVIPYRHFSVIFSRSRRIPRMTAVNIDGERARRIRASGDQWFADLRIERALQLRREDYANAAIDRGHMVRREDPNWGALAEAQEANGDTFHYTNSAPQHSGLNRNKHAWLGLEDYILGNSRTYGLRASVFAGPILRDGDRFLEGTDLQVPREFWKVIVMVDADHQRLHATGYVLGQGELVAALTEGFVFGEFGTYQVRLTDIANATGLDFSGLAKADPLARRVAEEAVDRAVVALPLGFPEEAYLG